MDKCSSSSTCGILLLNWSKRVWYILAIGWLCAVFAGGHLHLPWNSVSELGESWPWRRVVRNSIVNLKGNRARRIRSYNSRGTADGSLNCYDEATGGNERSGSIGNTVHCNTRYLNCISTCAICVLAVQRSNIVQPGCGINIVRVCKEHRSVAWVGCTFCDSPSRARISTVWCLLCGQLIVKLGCRL